ncbi:MAG: hypothetical protein DRI70_07845, partial [Bacteroidetes bacterium]
LFSWMDKFGAFFSEQIFGPLREKVVGAFGGTVLFWILVVGSMLAFIIIIYLLRHRLARFALIRKIKDIIKGVLDGLKTIFKMKRKWEFILHSLLIWFFYILMTWMVVFALEETSRLTFIDGMFLLVVGGLGMSAPVTAGFGAYHWITSRGLVFVYDFSLELGSAYAILAHESNSILTILMCAISYLLCMVLRKKHTIQHPA